MAASGIHRLSLKNIEKIDEPGRKNDGGGLYLRIEEGGTKSWTFRREIDGKTTWTALKVALRDYPDIDAFAAAGREKAAAMRLAIKDGRDPRSARATIKAAATSMTFEQAVRAHIESFEGNWKNPVHRGQWFKSMLGKDENGKTVEAEHDYTKSLRPLDVSEINTDRVIEVLAPIWSEKKETARRIRGRMETVLDGAKVKGYRTGDNPARWKGHLEHLLPSHKKRDVNHHAAVDFADLPDVMRQLKTMDGVSAKALAFVILTVVRTSSIIGVAGRADTPALDWTHIDMDKREWTIPRLKNDTQDYKIPLSDPAIAILREMRRITGGKGLVFPGEPRDMRDERSRGPRPLSNNAMLAVLKRMKIEATTHGMRSCCETWADEVADASDKVIAAVMSHGRSKTRAKAKEEEQQKSAKLKKAYSRDQLLDKRRKLMNEWARFLMPAMRVEKPKLKVVA